jgi:hypothetical protein
MLKVPRSALEEDGEEGKVAPEVGDEVSFEASGKVTAVDGDTVTVQVMKANGEDCQHGSSDDSGESDGEDNGEYAMESEQAPNKERGRLMAMARKYDKMKGM